MSATAVGFHSVIPLALRPMVPLLIPSPRPPRLYFRPQPSLTHDTEEPEAMSMKTHGWRMALYSQYETYTAACLREVTNEMQVAVLMVGIEDT
jgi:hypothetical protein